MSSFFFTVDAKRNLVQAYMYKIAYKNVVFENRFNKVIFYLYAQPISLLVQLQKTLKKIRKTGKYIYKVLIGPK